MSISMILVVRILMIGGVLVAVPCAQIYSKSAKSVNYFARACSVYGFSAFLIGGVLLVLKTVVG